MARPLASRTISPPSGSVVLSVILDSSMALALARQEWPLAWVRRTGLSRGDPAQGVVDGQPLNARLGHPVPLVLVPAPSLDPLARLGRFRRPRRPGPRCRPRSGPWSGRGSSSTGRGR